ITFLHADGDLDIYLLDGQQTVLARSISVTDDEQLVYAAAAAGTLYLRVLGYRGAENRYALTLAKEQVVPPCQDDRLEDDDTVQTAAMLQPQLLEQLVICPGDDDFYAVALNRGDRLAALISFTDAAGNLDLQLLGPDGRTVLASSISHNDEELVDAVAGQAGTYYLRVFAAAGVQNGYDLLVDVTPAPPVCEDDVLEENDTRQTPSLLQPGEHGSLAVCSGDDDFFAVALQAGDTLSVSLRFVHADGDLDLHLLDAAGNVLLRSTGTTDTEEVSYVAPAATTPVIRVFGFLGAAGPYSLSIVVEPPLQPGCLDDDLEENDSRAAARVLEPGLYDELQLCAGDDDFYAMALNAGDTLTATLSFVHADGDLDLALLDGQGNLLASSIGVRNEERIEHVAVAAGTVTLRVYGYRGASGVYDLKLDLVPAVPVCQEDRFEDNDGAATARPLDPGRYEDLAICSGDEDWFAVTLAAGEMLDAQISFTHAVGDLDLHLVDAVTRATLVRSDSFDDDEQVGYLSRNGGQYLLRVRGWQGAEAPYALQLTVTPPAGCVDDGMEENDSSRAATALLVGASIEGRICAGDADWFAVEIPAGRLTVIELSYSYLAGDLDLQVWDAADNLVGWSVDVDDDELILLQVEGGDQPAQAYVQVYGVGSAEGAYTLGASLIG
ncbi:MAG: hypothetical protein FJ125_13610, partial [Deltaproteobacteria bacterium]|nr:hypothetical protein [Deltaproteobacteria bacterium]